MDSKNPQDASFEALPNELDALLEGKEAVRDQTERFSTIMGSGNAFIACWQFTEDNKCFGYETVE
jgi:hypothetical protein